MVTRAKKQQRQQHKPDRDTHLYLPEDLWQQMMAAAEKEDRSVTAMIRVLVKEALQARSAGQRG